MTEEKWEVLAEVHSSGLAEALQGLLRANGIEAILSQEAVGKSIYPTMFGLLGQIQILVPSQEFDRAQVIFESFERGDFEDAPMTGDTGEDMPTGGDQG